MIYRFCFCYLNIAAFSQAEVIESMRLKVERSYALFLVASPFFFVISFKASAEGISMNLESAAQLVHCKINYSVEKGQK